MSTFKVPMTRVSAILPHPNADRLEIAKVYEWLVVTGKGNLKTGDPVVYFPVDSILPQELEMKLFPADSKIKLEKHRIRSIKIRGHISQGMIVSANTLRKELSAGAFDDEDDVSALLGVTKYEQPERDLPAHMRLGPGKKKRKDNPNFHKYNDIENFKWYDRIFQDGEEVYISEKLHGTSFRCGWVRTEANTFWKRLLKLLRLLPEFEFCYGSRTVQIQWKWRHRGYYAKDVYTKMVKQYNLKERVPKGMSLYGEIVGHGIQKNYEYGHAPDQHSLYVYDLKRDDTYLGADEFLSEMMLLNVYLGTQMPLNTVPTLFLGPYTREVLDSFRDGDSRVGGQKVREGVVIKARTETNSCVGRKVLKYISDGYYLLKDGTDFH